MWDDKFLPGPEFIFSSHASQSVQATYRVTDLSVGVPQSYSPLLVGYLDIPPRYLGGDCQGKKDGRQEQMQNNRARCVSRHGADTDNWRSRGCCRSLLIPAQLWWVGSKQLSRLPSAKGQIVSGSCKFSSTYLASNGPRSSSRQQNCSSAEPKVRTVIVLFTVTSVCKTVNKSKSETQAGMP